MKKESTPTSTEKNKNSENKAKTPFWKKYFLSLLLLLGIIISVVWGIIKENRLTKDHNSKIERLAEDHTKAMDSIVVEKAKMITSTFALAVRSELIDENIDQVNQYCLQMIKNKQISKIMLVDHKNGKVIMSTNRKDESTTFTNDKLLNVDDVSAEIKGSSIITATPVMGLNTQTALLIIESER
ncbi:MAG: hypothetical protein WED10_02405 [Brumimicrobium sp.]